jgi:hypothetical protein
VLPVRLEVELIKGILVEDIPGDAGKLRRLKKKGILLTEVHDGTRR